MKRLLCVLSNMNAGGAETFLMKLHRNLDKNKYQMDYCINVFEENFYEDEIRELGGKVFKIPSRSKDFKEHNKQFVKIIRENKYEYILSVSANAMAYLDLVLAKKNGAKRCIIRSSNSNLNDKIQTKIIKSIMRKMFSHYADIWFAPSDLAAENLFGKNYRNNKRFHYLNNALDLDQYSFSTVNREEIRREFSIDEDTFVVGHVGRFYRQKNHDFLIDVFEKIVQKKEKSILLLVGDGELYSAIKEKAKEKGLSQKVVFAGTRSDVNKILSAFDVFVFPSFYEGMPNTVIEAETNGLPCVVSSSITKDAKIMDNIRYLPLSESPNQWAETALSLEREEQSLDRMRDNGYDIQKCVRYFEQVVFN